MMTLVWTVSLLVYGAYFAPALLSQSQHDQATQMEHTWDLNYPQEVPDESTWCPMESSHFDSHDTSPSSSPSHLSLHEREHQNESRLARTHVNGEEYEADVQELLSCLIKKHGISKTIAYKYVRQGMEGGIIFDLDIFKQQCIDRWEQNRATFFADVPRGRRRRLDYNDEDSMEDEDIANQLLALSCGPSRGEESMSSATSSSKKEVYRIKSSNGKQWKYTIKGQELFGELKSYGMSQDTARRYIEKGIKSGKIDDLVQFKQACRRKYIEQGIRLGRYARLSGT